MTEPTRRLAVFGDCESTVAVAAAEAVEAPPVAVEEADAVVAVGRDAIREAVRAVADRAAASVPILPVGSGRHAVDGDRALDRLDAFVDALGGPGGSVGPFARVSHPVLAVEGAGDRRRLAAADVAFVTAEPARISEYGIEFSNGESAAVRADGAVIATPLGSDGYAAAAGGPVVSPGGGLSVVPVAPFTTRADTWIATDGVRVTVEREEESVALIVDGTHCGTVDPHRDVTIEVAAAVDLLVAVDA